MLPSFPVFGVEIPLFGVMMLIGIIAAFVLLWRTRRIIPFTEDSLFTGALWAIILGFLGSKILFWIVEFDYVLADPRFLLQTLRTGFVFYGALIGGVLGVLIYASKKKLPFLAFIDLFAPSLVLAHAFGRIGCFLAGCCYGRPTDSCIGVTFPPHSSAPAGIPLIPTQLFESAFLFLLTIFLVWLLKKRRTFGTVTGWYLILYGVWRFFIEFFRNDARGAVGSLSTSQFIGIFMIVGGILLLVLIAKGIVSRGTLPDEEVTLAEEESLSAEDLAKVLEQAKKPPETAEKKPSATKTTVAKSSTGKEMDAAAATEKTTAGKESTKKAASAVPKASSATVKVEKKPAAKPVADKAKAEKPAATAPKAPKAPAKSKKTDAD